MNVLLFDLENGSKTLGSREAIQKSFGLPVLAPRTFEDFGAVLGQLYTSDGTEHTVKVGNVEIQEFRNERMLRDSAVPIDAVVIDTFSELSKKYQRNLTRDDGGTMKISSWGKLKNKLDSLLEYITTLPGVVICNCHSKIQTMDDGQNKVLPYIDGSTKEDIAKWFDFVFYTKTNVDLKDNASYVWVTGRSEKYDHAKDRTGLLDREIPQDYQLVLNASREAGFEGSKILVIGTPGSGKTYALQTLIRTPEVKTTTVKKSEGVTA